MQDQGPDQSQQQQNTEVIKESIEGAEEQSAQVVMKECLQKMNNEIRKSRSDIHTDKKRKSFSQLKNWDSKKNKLLQFQNNLALNIWKTLQNKYSQSESTNQQVIRFFKDLLQVELTILKASKGSVNLSQVLKGNQKIGELSQGQIYPNLHKFFGKVEQNQENYRKEQFAYTQMLEKQIVKTLIDENNEYQKIYNKMNENIISKDKRMQIINQLNIEISSKFTKFFYDMVTNNKSSNDFYLEKLKFMQTQKDLIQIHKLLGEDILILWERLLHLQYNRIQTYQKVFALYLEHKNKQSQTSNLGTLEELHNLKAIEECENEFKIMELVNPELQTSLFEKLNKPKDYKLTLEDLKSFLIHFELDELQKDPLIVNEVKILRDIGTITSSFKVFTVLFTVDNRLLFIKENINKDDKNKGPNNITQQITFQQPDACIQAQFSQLIPKNQGKLIYEIQENVKGLLFNSKTKLILKFQNEANLQEFQDSLNYLQVGN